MSTTVSYKDSTIATANKSTVTLATQGKYLEADVVIVDSSQTIYTGTSAPSSSLGANGDVYIQTAGGS